jgi:hypothetical protein
MAKIEYNPDGTVKDPHLHERPAFVLGEEDEPRREPLGSKDWVRFDEPPLESDSDWYGLDEDFEIRVDLLRKRYLEMLVILRGLVELRDTSPSDDPDSFEELAIAARGLFDTHGIDY